MTQPIEAKRRQGGAPIRRWLRQLLVHVALVALVFTFTADFASEPEAADDGGGTEAEAEAWRHVTRVIDGDTIVLDGGERVRLIGVDTPETVHSQ